MRVAHLADLHLGHRAFARRDRGQNVRERDLAVAFKRAVDAMLELAPDLVVISGDVFDRPDPPPGALVSFTRGLEAFHARLPDTRVLMVAGARDTPRRAEEAGALAALDAFPNVDAAVESPRIIRLSRYGAQVVLLPYRSALMEPRPVFDPNPRWRWNLVVAHGRPAPGAQVGIALDTRRWDYVALGGLHSYRRIGERAAYAGALERVGPTPWAEAAEEKGFVMVDLEGREIVFHPIPGRPVVALAPTRVPAGQPQALQARILEVVREVPGGIDGKIVRIRLKGADPGDVRGLEPGLLADLSDRALHLSLEFETRPKDQEAAPLDAEARARAALSGTDDRARALLERVLAGAGGWGP